MGVAASRCCGCTQMAASHLVCNACAATRSADFSIVDAKSTSVTAERRARATNQMCDDDMVAVVRGPRVLRCDMQASVAGVWAEGLRVA